MTANKLQLLFTYNADSICDVVSMKFHVDALHNFKVMLRTKFKYEKWTKSNNSKSMKLWVMVLLQCTFPQWDLSTYEV